MSHDTDVGDAVLERLLQRYGDSIEYLNLNQCRNLSEDMLNRAVDGYLGGNLKGLFVANTAITCPILHELPGIQHLDLAGADLQDVCHASLLPTGTVLPEPAVARLESVRLGYTDESDWHAWYRITGMHALFLHILLKYHAKSLKKLWFGGSLAGQCALCRPILHLILAFSSCALCSHSEAAGPVPAVGRTESAVQCSEHIRILCCCQVSHHIGRCQG